MTDTYVPADEGNTSAADTPEKTPVRDILIVLIGSILIFSLLFVFREKDAGTGSKVVKCVHSYSAATGNVCQICGAVYEPEIEEIDRIMYTAKNNVVVRSDYYTGDNVVERLPLNTPVMVEGYFLSAIDSEWYVTEDGYYIYAPNLMDEPYVCTVHSYGTEDDPEVCKVCGHRFVAEPEEYHMTMYAVKDGVTVRTTYYNDNNTIAKLSQNDRVEVVSFVENASGNTWYQLETGGYIFADNLSPEKVPCTDHVFEGNFCVKCGYEFVPEITTLDMTVYAVKSGTIVRSDYYSGDNTVRKLAFDEAVHVKGMLTNSLGSVWYVLDDGTYVYSKNVSASKTPCTDHPYTSEGGDVCPVCDHVYEPIIVEMDTIMYATKDNVAVRNTYYSNTDPDRTLEKNEAVRVTGRLTNSIGKEWYRISGDYYVFADNLSNTETD